MRNISEKNCIDNEGTCFMFNNVFRFEIMWTNIVERSRPEMTVIIWRMLIASWTAKATNPHSVTCELDMEL